MNVNIRLISWLIILVGYLAIVFLKDYNFFPWIFFVIGISRIPALFFSDKKLSKLQTIVLFCGMTLLFSFKMFWPGILVLIGINMTLGGFKSKKFHQLDLTKRGKNQNSPYVTYD